MIDLYDALWAPRLIASEAVTIIKDSIDRKIHRKVHLPMLKHKEDHLYPRVRLRRASYISLNGEWELAHKCPYDEDISDDIFTDRINVPYPVEAALSGVDPYEVSTQFAYRRYFNLPEGFVKDRIILHFGAVDQECRVYVNGKLAGEHEGGYLPFEFDITDVTDIPGENEIIVKVRDELNRKFPYGKQTLKPEGMWYTPVSGIWQTVWLESLPPDHIDRVICSYLEGNEKGNLEIRTSGTFDECSYVIYGPVIDDEEYPDDDPKIRLSDTIIEGRIHNGCDYIEIPGDKLRLWSPDEPYIYYIRLRSIQDEVLSYFTLKTVSIEKVRDKDRICLNHKPVFLHGVLDQGYFSDGLYTPVSDRYYEDDIRNMKDLGFNVIRKHIKVEPERFYYDCDRLGMIVFQDMVNNGEYSFVKHTAMPTFAGQWKNDEYEPVPQDIKDFFIKHSVFTVKHLMGFGCIILYTVFNEGWGQFESERVTEILKEADGSKIYDGASGWFKQENGDIDSDHFYYHKIKPHHWSRPVIISECGGFTRSVGDHSHSPDKTYGYGDFSTEEALTKRIFKMYDDEVIPNLKHGICGCVYTQVSDVETETNGLYTYDREICKVNREKMKELAFKLNKAYSYVTEDHKGEGK
ncbi:MAG: glycoside hydrolase family 2 [Lachnospiraceae bacterium]|nr:glycoside hydrolase family 2 [Lachnospiraceae bacterium]